MTKLYIAGHQGMVGSALVRRLLEEQGPDGAAAFIGSFRDAID